MAENVKNEEGKEKEVFYLVTRCSDNSILDSHLFHSEEEARKKYEEYRDDIMEEYNYQEMYDDEEADYDSFWNVGDNYIEYTDWDDEDAWSSVLYSAEIRKISFED